MKKLIIVESPHKAKTIQKYLGSEATVMASKGHVCDLPQRSLGIDVDNGFKPQYVVTPDKESTIRQLSQAVGNRTYRKGTYRPRYFRAEHILQSRQSDRSHISPCARHHK